MQAASYVSLLVLFLALVWSRVDAVSPGDFSNLKLWLDANDLTMGDGASVDTWSDKSGNNNHVFQTIPAYQPTFTSTGFDGKPAVTFTSSKDGSTSGEQFPSSIQFLHRDQFDFPSSEVTIIAAILPTTSQGGVLSLRSEIAKGCDGGYSFYRGGTVTNAVADELSFYSSDACPSSDNVRENDGIQLGSTTTTASNIPQIVAIRKDGTALKVYAASSPAGVVTAVKTQASASIRSGFCYSDSYPSMAYCNDLLLGLASTHNENYGSGNPMVHAFDGYIGEIVVSNEALSDIQMADLLDYFRAKWLSCGDGILDAGEECDDGAANADSAACTSTCQNNVCGDGKQGPGEQCDNGGSNSNNAACTSTCTNNVCGDTFVGPGEQCDNGINNGNDKACTSACQNNVCGDGFQGPTEECDDGNANADSAACTSTCENNVCGDGKPGPGEQCDNGGSNSNNAACTSTCTNNVCGDTFVGPGEQCDNGINNGNDKACTSACQNNVCGDGFQGPTEECDNGNANADGAACTSDCLINVCGDDKPGPGEECDNGAMNADDAACTSTCTNNVCGDTFVGPGEQCDNGINNGNDKACTSACQNNVCGDGFQGPTEECDNGNANADSAACTSDCLINVCGDGKQGPGEECDNGAMNANDAACTSTCTNNVCGDTFVGPGEQCDNGINNGNDKACTSACQNNVCGDGFQGPTEECDNGDGNGDRLSCTEACQNNICGDGFHGPGEECDNGGSNDDSAACTSNCLIQVCGDGKQGPNEQCDDGNANNADNAACTSECMINVCGDDKQGPGEECDNGNANSDNAACTSGCKINVCGDGLVGPGEECDNGGSNDDSAACTSNCLIQVCGDGKQGPNEQCDDGNANNADNAACTSECMINVCGDDKQGPGEECDNGNANSDNAACTSGCKINVCGDGLVGPGEECDNGGSNDDSAACTSGCKDNVCGDDLVGPGEECDDGANANSDSAACTSGCKDNVCGDGLVGPGEECDDGGSNDDSAACTSGCKNNVCGDGLVGPGEECDHGASNDDSQSCTASCNYQVCGDSLVGQEEACDDGNTESGDGCASFCAWEEESVCDLVRSCGYFNNETCTQIPVRQSTFFDFHGIPVSNLVDGNRMSCAKTAPAKLDTNPQWVRVALGMERLVGTVRFWSQGSASDFTVFVTQDDATVQAVQNPTVGATLPAERELCSVRAMGDNRVFEAHCPAATKALYVFIAASQPNQELEVCDVEVFSHTCALTGETLSCGLGYEPSPCNSCQGCVPCAAGYYSDKIGTYECTPCPGDIQPYSPPGSSSVFQCDGFAYLDGTSTLDIVRGGVRFNLARDAWEIDIAFSLAPRIQINGVSTVFISDGGQSFNPDIYTNSKFPCRSVTSAAAGADLSASLSETICCLEDMRNDYVMTKIFRNFTDTLDLVAANDECDADDGSDLLVNAGLEVVGAGTVFVDTAGRRFSNAITIVPIEAPAERRSQEYYEGTQYARITIPDAELYKISKSLNPQGNLTDSREIFVGLLDMLPTGTRVVDSSSQQISIVLTRTQYGTFAAYGEQNIDYDFISYLNGRVHGVFNQSAGESAPAEYYAEITYVIDDRLQPQTSMKPINEDTVTVDESATCTSSASNTVTILKQDCAPKALAWATEDCPQISIADDHLGRIYIPLGSSPPAPTVSISFDLVLIDTDGRNASLNVQMDLVTNDFVSWCDAEEDSVDLATRVIPSIIIGTETDNPPRIRSFANAVFTTEAETLQDGLITLVLELNETAGLDDNLEVYIEDVLVVHVNPGSNPDLNTIMTYEPTYTYYPDTRDAKMNIPPELVSQCPAADFSETFFGCTHKHIFRNKKVTNETECYLVGSIPPPATGAQEFMETMLGSGTASVASKELGRDYEAYLMREGVPSRKKVALWINPGHQWGQVVHNSEYSLSQNVIFYVLYGVNSGVDGSTRRSMLQVSSDGTNTVSKTIQYNVDVATVVEAMDDVTAIFVKATMSIDNAEACLPAVTLKPILASRMQAAVAPHASAVRAVHTLSVEVENADCDGEQRRASGQAPVAKVDAIVALEKSENAFIDMGAVVASGVGVLAMQETDSPLVNTAKPTPGPDEKAGGEPEAAAGDSGSSSDTIAIACGAAAGVVLLSLVGWKVYGRLSKAKPLSDEDVMVTVVADEAGSQASKKQIEGLLFDSSDTCNAKSSALKEPAADLSIDHLLGGGDRRP